jgi:hypothetical protein
MAVETQTQKTEAKADAEADKALSPEQKADKELHEKNRKQQEARAKFVDETVGKLHDEVKKTDGGLGSTHALTKDIADRVARTQVVAVGAQYGPSPTEIDKLNKQVFPIVAPPMSDGTPVANIAQVEKKDDQPEQPKESVPTTEKHATDRKK